MLKINWIPGAGQGFNLTKAGLSRAQRETETEQEGETHPDQRIILFKHATGFILFKIQILNLRYEQKCSTPKTNTH